MTDATEDRRAITARLRAESNAMNRGYAALEKGHEERSVPHSDLNRLSMLLAAAELAVEIDVERCEGCEGCEFDVDDYFSEQLAVMLMRPPVWARPVPHRLEWDVNDDRYVLGKRLTVIEGRNARAHVTRRRTMARRLERQRAALPAETPIRVPENALLQPYSETVSTRQMTPTELGAALTERVA